MSELECPRCHTRTDFAQLGRDVASFCPVCGYPMFYAADTTSISPTIYVSSAVAQADFTRRLPGVRGISSLNPHPCWNCGEHNDMDASRCWRCHRDLLQPPVDEPPSAPEDRQESVVKYAGDELEDENPGNHSHLLVGLGIAAVALLILLRFAGLLG